MAMDKAGDGGVEDRYPLSPIQQSLLAETLATSGKERVGLIQMVWDLPEALELAAFEQAWHLVVRRHSILRTRLVWRGCARPFQEVVRQVRVPFAAVDLTQLPRQELERRLAAALLADRERGIDLECAPLLRVLVIRFDRTHHRVVLTLHHTIIDGRTVLALVPEVFTCYEAVRRDETPDLPPAGIYRAYIEWLAHQDLGRAEAFWRQALRGFREPTAPGIARAERLPARWRDEVAAPAAWFSQDAAGWFSEETTAALSRFAASLDLTLNTLLLATWSLLLARYGGVRDVLFGVVRTHRGVVPGSPAILGPMMASVPFHATVASTAHLGSWLRAVRREWLAMRAGDFAAPAQIRDWSELDPQAPFFATLVLVETHEITERLRQLGGQWRHRSFRYLRQPRVPLTVYGYIEERLQLKVIFDPARFDAASMQRLLGHLQTVLEAMPGGAERPVAELPLLSAAERHQLLVDWNDTAGDGRWQPVHRRFEEQARRTPHALAVTGAGGSRSYGQVEESANRLASLLASRAVGPGSIVAVLLERSSEEMAALLGILKAGGAYLPLEGAAAERLDFILENAGAAVLVTRSTLRPALRFPACRIFELDRAAQELEHQPLTPCSRPVSAQHPAYVVYTSGSTGEPKGVVVAHRGLSNLVSWHLRAFACSAVDRASRLAGLGFDAAVWELWPYWSTGATIVLPLAEVRSAPEALRDWLIEEGITIAFAPTPLAERLVELDWPGRPALRLLLTGGDALRSAPAGGLPFTLINNYGPTESSVVATSGEVAPAADPAARGLPPTIGRPIRNLRIQVLDPELRPLPIGVRGEIMIAGPGLAQGYLGRAALTAASFVPDPHGRAGDRMYRTGDLARFLPGGALEFLGRRDAQIKLRGFRIEPGEIEAALDRHPAVQGSAVVCRGAERVEGKQLVAFLVGVSGSSAGDDELAAFLRGQLPGYMIPTLFRWLDDFPLTASGKLDRKALEALAATVSGHAREPTPPGTPLERLLAGVWEDVLDRRPIGLHDDFFALGGSSLNVMQAVAVLQELLDRDVSMDLVFLAPTVSSLMERLFPSEEERRLAEEDAATALKTDRGAEQGTKPRLAPSEVA